jgi:hypothetical protein
MSRFGVTIRIKGLSFGHCNLSCVEHLCQCWHFVLLSVRSYPAFCAALNLIHVQITRPLWWRYVCHHSCEEIWRWPLKSGAYQWHRPVYSLSTYPWFHMIHLLWVYSTNVPIYWEERSSRLRWFEKVVSNHGAQGFLLQSTIDLCLASPIVSYSNGCVSSGYLKEGVDDWYYVLQRGLLKR